MIEGYKTTEKSYMASTILVCIFTSILPITQVNINNLLQNSLLSSSTTSYVGQIISPRAERVRAVRGKYSFVPTSSDDFALRKQKEIKLELV